MIKHSIEGPLIRIETNAIEATIRTEGYTSGVAAGSFVDKKTGSRDVGFGLSIVDFLLEPADSKGDQRIDEDVKSEPRQYEYGGKYRAVHGDIPKRYVEGPQICTQAKKLPFEIIEGDGFLVVRQWFTWHQGYPPYQGGSRWDQVLIFTERDRYFFSADRVTTVNRCPSLILRIDMPGHIKHSRGDTFEHVYLSYASAMIPSTEFAMDFPPDGQYWYRRGRASLPERFIRAYQVRRAGGDAQSESLNNQGAAASVTVKLQTESTQRAGPWLAGITLNPADVYEAWCHQRGYVCMIEEVGGRPTNPGNTFGAAYIVGWFDEIGEMNEAADRYRGWSGIELKGIASRPSSFAGVKQADLKPVQK